MTDTRLDNAIVAKDSPTVSDNVARLANAANSADGAKTLQSALAGASDTAQAHLPTLDISYGQSTDTSTASGKEESKTTRYADGYSTVVQKDGQGDTTTTKYDNQHRVTSVDSKNADGSEKISAYDYDATTGIKTGEFHSTTDSQHNIQSTFKQYDGQTGQLTDSDAIDSRTHTGSRNHYENGQLAYEVFANNQGDMTTNYFDPGSGVIDYQQSSHADGSEQQKWFDTDTQQVSTEIDEDKNGEATMRGNSGGSFGISSKSY